jgi:hypothetical protein
MSSLFNENEENREYRLLEVIPKGMNGKKVEIKYYDTKTGDVHVKEDEWEHITPTIEINLKKYEYESADEIISELEGIYPGRFEEQHYGKRKTEKSDASKFYSGGQETTIIWHYGNREDRKDLEFFLDDKKKKQIFIRNSPKRFKARTIVMDDDTLEREKEYLEDILKEHNVQSEDIKINERRKYIEVKCEEPLLKKLDPEIFRINVYESKQFNKEKDAEEFLEEIKKTEDFKTYIDQAKVVKIRKSNFDIKHCVRITLAENKNFKKIKGMMRLSEEGKKSYRAREELWDPLHLNSPTKQLNDFFPAHTIYKPSKKLSEQANKKTPAFSHYSFEDPSELEKATEAAYNFYLKNSAIIDLEVTDYDTNIKDKVTGRIFMAVLEAENEKKIYFTKEAWRDEKNKDYFINETKGTKLVFVEDEIELISALTKDSQKYEYIIGHNFKEYDQKHMVKYNDENALFKEGKISLEDKERIKRLKKENKTNRLWNKSLNNILDTHKYVKNRIHVLEDYKLATFAGFDKTISYKEMERLLKSGRIEDVQKIINYTVEDGVKTKEITDLLLRNATIESLASNKKLSSVFTTNPIKNFYDAGTRNYFMQMHTYKNRHEFSPISNLEKLEARESPDELIYQLLKGEKQVEGIISGTLIFPDVIINSCKNIILNNYATRLIYQEMKRETNFLIKIDMLQKLHSFLHVPVDKIKNFMKAAGLEFGKKYELSDVYKTYELENNEDAYFEEKKDGCSDYEFSRTNYIFSAEYKTDRRYERRGLILYDYVMLDINNKIAEGIDNMRGKDSANNMQRNIISRTEGLYVLKKNEGYELGDIRAVNFKDKGLIGKIEDYKLYLNRQKPRGEGEALVKEMLNSFFEGATQDELRSVYESRILNAGAEFWKSKEGYIRALTGINPKKSKGTPTLF